MQSATEHEAPHGLRHRREKDITIKTKDKQKKVQLWFKSIKDLPVPLEGSAYIF